MLVNRWIETHARVRGDKVALVDLPTGRRLTYADLQRESLRAAYVLAGQGVGAGDRVGVYAHNCPETLFLLLGCGLLGACLVPFNWRLAPNELEKVAADCQPRLTFIDPALPASPLQGPALSDLAGLPAHPVELSFVPAETPLAIFYTGGTTGVPKGATLTHTSLQWNAWNTISGWGLAPDDVSPVFTPLFHTGGLNVLLAPLLCLGGTSVLPGPFSPAGALDVIEQEGCTLVFLVPTMYEMLRHEPGFRPARLARVRMWISGGAPCPRSLFEAFWEQGLDLVQGYGLTEAGPNTFGVDPRVAKQKIGTVGTPLAGIEARLAPPGEPEPAPGVAGELHVRGGHVMAGYWGRPKETAEAISPDGWLETGDLAYRDEDGYFFICGRRKEMFISGGENVFPAEIEEALLTHPSVAEAAVVGVSHPKWGEVGRAFLVLKPGAAWDEASLLAHCKASLAGYKVPKEYLQRDELPKSAAGKVLKRDLN